MTDIATRQCRCPYRHDQMRGHKPTPRDAELAEIILLLLTAPGIIEVSRTQISNFLWRNETSRDIAAALAVLHHDSRARCRMVRGVKKPFELWHALKQPPTWG